MFKLLLAAHLVLAVFAVGPLVQAATTAGRGIRTGDGAATAAASRVLRIYGYASVLVVVVGMALMSQKEDGERVAEFSEAWIWVSLLLWLAAAGLAPPPLLPALGPAPPPTPP